MQATELNLLQQRLFCPINHRKSRHEPDLRKKTSSADANVRHSFHELVDGAGVRVASFDVVLLPVDVADLAGDVSAYDVVLFDLVKRQVRVIHANQHNTRIVSAVDQDFVVQLGHWDLSSTTIHVQVDVVSNIVGILELRYSKRAGVNVECNSAVGG